MSTDDEIADDVLPAISTTTLVVGLPRLPGRMESFEPQGIHDHAGLVLEAAQVRL